MKRSKLLFVVGILLIVIGGFGLISGVVSLITTSMNASLHTAEIVDIVRLTLLPALMTLGGIFAVLSYSTPYRFSRVCVGIGVVVLVLSIASGAFTIISAPNVLPDALAQMDLDAYMMDLVESLTGVIVVLGVIISWILPLLFFIGAIRHNKYAGMKEDAD